MDLVKAAVAGGRHEADDLIRAVWPVAYRIAYSVLRSRSFAEDAAQEACAVLFRSIRRLRNPEAFDVWFYRIVLRETLATQRRNSRPDQEAEPISECGLDDSVARVDLLTALAALPPAQRIAIALRYYADMTSAQIAEVLGVADSSVRFNIMSAKRTLRKHLECETFSKGDHEHGVA